MIEPTAFGLYLKEKRKAAMLTQGELAAAINKTGQYISNIEKGKNNAPPNETDLEALIEVLALKGEDRELFLDKAAADRNRLPANQMEYIRGHKELLMLIEYGVKNNIGNRIWAKVLKSITKDV